MTPNIEAIHAEYFREMVEFAQGALDGAPELACLISDGEMADESIDNDCGVDLTVLAQFALPGGSAELINRMARFCYHSLVPREVNGRPVPELSFALAPLLRAAFPRNTRDGVFWNTAGGVMAAIRCPSCEKVEPWEVDFLAFAGLGIILMDQVRMALRPHASDEEVIEMSEKFWVGIYD